MQDSKTVTTKSLAEQREIYLAHLKRERDGINARYGKALEELNVVEKLYEDWYGEQEKNNAGI